MYIVICTLSKAWFSLATQKKKQAHKQGLTQEIFIS